MLIASISRIVVVVLSLLTAGSSFSQEKKFVIQQGSTLDYVVHTPNGDVAVSTVLSKVSEEEVRFDWVMNQAMGTFRVEKASLDSARHGYWNPPIDGQDFTLDESRCLLQLSKACWKDIQLNRPMAFGSAKYKVKQLPIPYKVGDYTLDYLYLESEDGHSSLWIANNEKLPMILKTENNPDGVNVELMTVR